MDTTEKTNYNIEDFSKKLIAALSEENTTENPLASPVSGPCQILYQPIIIESYAGLGAALHNANELGFFKSRGKIHIKIICYKIELLENIRLMNFVVSNLFYLLWL
ncbi:UNVERIFIED_CONTAM: hypothetical protein NCL1_23808 [Trichonephila clavipes]